MTGTLVLHDADDELLWTFPNLAGPGTIIDILYLFHWIFQVVCDRGLVRELFALMPAAARRYMIVSQFKS